MFSQKGETIPLNVHKYNVQQDAFKISKKADIFDVTLTPFRFLPNTSKILTLPL